MTTDRDPANIYIGVRPGKKGKLVPFGHRRDRDNPSPALRESQNQFAQAAREAKRLGLRGEEKKRFIGEYMKRAERTAPYAPGRWRPPRVWEEDLKKAGAEEGLKVTVEPQPDGEVLVTVVPEEEAEEMVEVLVLEEPELVEVVVDEPEEEKRRKEREGS